MASTSHHEASDILEAALDNAFSQPPETSHSTAEVKGAGASDAPVASPPAAVAAGGQKLNAEPSSVASSSASDDSWKEEYDAQLRSWHAQSAEQREKAEKERARWEAIRAEEKAEAESRKAAGLPPVAPPPQEGWQKVGASSVDASSSSLVDVAADIDNSGQAKPPTQTHSQVETGVEELQKWEDVPSLASSFPSISFDATPPPPPAEPSTSKSPASVTLSIFDSSLSTRTRLLAFVSSLAVNLLLPFVNGVMLGFGEIFAKNVAVGWFGWKNAATTNVGLRTNSRTKTFR